MGVENLGFFFNPRVIAVIGASGREDSIGGKILRNLAGHYNGSVLPVNPFRRTVQGFAAFPSVERLPSKPDLAIIATPAHTIPQILEECGRASVTNIIIVSAGFEKNVEDGRKLHERILELKRVYKLRILGPNSFGVIRPKTNLHATFGEKKALPGKIAFISQSAALCGLVLDWSQETQVGLSAVVSTGSSIDVDVSDLINYFGEDPQTRAILVYVEDLKNVRSFMSAARGFARTKPIVLIKASRFAERKEDSLVKTGATVDEDALFDAVFRRVGVVRVNTVTELLACGKALSMQPNPVENCLTIITNAGGPGTMAVDALEARGGHLWNPSENTVNLLKNVLPYYCNVSNPIDVLEEAAPDRFGKVLQICLNDPTVKGMLLIYTSLGSTDPLSLANVVTQEVVPRRKPILAVIMGEDNNCQKARRLLNQNGIPAFETPEEAVSAFMYMHAYTRNLELLYQTPEEIQLATDIPAHLKGIIRRAFCEGRHSLSLPEAFSFLDAYGIPTLKTLLALNVEQARKFASEIGFPVEMESACSRLSLESGKTGRSCYNAYSLDDVEAVYDSINRETMVNESPEFQGILIRPKSRPEEFRSFVGSRRVPRFGSVILFEPGVAEDSRNIVSVGFPPLNQVLAKQMVDNSGLASKTRGLIDIRYPQADALEETLVRLSQLVIDFPEIERIDVNPIVLGENCLYAENAGMVIDRERTLRQASDHHDHLVVCPYPKKYMTLRTLKNGATVRLRPIKPEDENRFNELFKSLSEESVRFRFFETIKELSHDTLTRYCNLDYDREIAIVAELTDQNRIVGVARIVTDLSGRTGEFAIMVDDKWQGLGLGSKLIDVIFDVAKDLRLEKIYSYVSRGNSKMIQMSIKKGFGTESTDEYVVTMSKKLVP